MKRWIAALLALTLALSMTACKKDKGNSAAQEVPFTSQELVNNEICKVTASWVDFVPGKGYVMDLAMENVMGSSLQMSISKASVNGCMCNPQWEYTLEREEKTVNQVIFPEEKLNAYGITDVTHIQFNLIIDNPESEEETLLQETYNIYPKGEKLASVQVREKQETDIVLVDNEYCTIYVLGKKPDSFFGLELELYTVNKTDKTLRLAADNETLNGVEYDGFWVDADLEAGKSGISTLYWFENRMEGLKAADIHTITMKIMADTRFAQLGELFTQDVTIKL